MKKKTKGVTLSFFFFGSKFWILISQLWKGLEPPFLHSGQSLTALYHNPEFWEDWRNLIFRPKMKKNKRGNTVVFFGGSKFWSLISQLWKGLEPPFLHSGQSLRAPYHNPEFWEDWRHLIFRPKMKKNERGNTVVFFSGRNFEVWYLSSGRV